MEDMRKLLNLGGDKSDMHLGKTISLAQASRILGKKYHDDCDLHWTLRYCLTEYIKICIRIPYFIGTWERNEDPWKDAKKDKIVSGKGDYISRRMGVFFLNINDYMDLSVPHLKKIGCENFFALDTRWGKEFVDFKVASEQEIAHRKGFNSLVSNNPDMYSQQDWIELGINDLYVWKEDWEDSFKDENFEQRKNQAGNETTVKKETKKEKRLPIAKKAIIYIYGSIDAVIPVGDGDVKKIFKECQKLEKGKPKNMKCFDISFDSFSQGESYWKFIKENLNLNTEQVAPRNR